MNFGYFSGTDETILERLTAWGCVKALGYTCTGIENIILSNNSKCRIVGFSNQLAGRRIEITNSYAMDVGPISVHNTTIKNKTRISRIFVVEDFLQYHAGDLPKEVSWEKYVQLLFNIKKVGLEPLLEFLENLFLGLLKPRNDNRKLTICDNPKLTTLSSEYTKGWQGEISLAFSGLCPVNEMEGARRATGISFTGTRVSHLLFLFYFSGFVSGGSFPMCS